MISNAFCKIILLVLFISCTSPASPQTESLEDSVKSEFLHAWNAYKQYAWGHDALKPLSKAPHDWYGRSLCMTPVDALDLMLIIELNDEAALAKQLIIDSLSFDRNIEVQFFEVNIRLVGGLLSAYELDRDERLLRLAEDLANRLLPVYDSKTGMPYRYVNLRTGKVRDSLNNPAEIGTTLLEMGTLSRLTGNPVYWNKAKNAVVQLFNRRGKTGLVGTVINVETGEWTNKTSHIGGMIDSYYEYLMKAWLLFGDKDCKSMWDQHIVAVNDLVADTTYGGLWYGQVDMDTGKRTGTKFGSLEAFFPAVLCLAGDVPRAKKLQESCYRMWNLYNIEPEELDYSTMEPTAKQYYLRPEIIESAYYLFKYTENPEYLDMGRKFFHDIVKYCRVDAGYAMLEDVVTKQKRDVMESFFFAETLKYLYLLFAPENTLAFDKVIFTTEAHPLFKDFK